LKKSAYDLRNTVPGGQKNEHPKWFALNPGQYIARCAKPSPKSTLLIDRREIRNLNYYPFSSDNKHEYGKYALVKKWY
jgi:hypothetical protein